MIRVLLVIEGNILSKEQIIVIIENKCVIGFVKDILEVKNVIEVYNVLDEFDVFFEEFYLKVYGILMLGLVEKLG